MKRQPSLLKLRHQALAHLQEMRPAAKTADRHEGGELVKFLTFFTLDLHNACKGFLRSYYVSSATGSWLSTGERSTSSLGFCSEDEAINFAVRFKGQRGNGPWRMRDEPAWHDIGMFLAIMNSSGCTTAKGANAAWSIGTATMEHLTWARNYFAHRNRETALRVKALYGAYKVASTTRPEELLVSRARARPQLVIEDWLDDLAAAIGLMPA